jgi:hypothetical protein
VFVGASATATNVFVDVVNAVVSNETITLLPVLDVPTPAPAQAHFIGDAAFEAGHARALAWRTSVCALGLFGADRT